MLGSWAQMISIVIFDILGFKLKEPVGGKIMSEFAKNLIYPLCCKDPELRIKQKGQFSRIYKSWDKILEFLINPGGLNASGVIEDCKIAVYALKDCCAEKLPMGIKIKGLGLACWTTETQLPTNGSILEKICELKPHLPAGLKTSFEPWPKNKVAWSQSMKN